MKYDIQYNKHIVLWLLNKTSDYSIQIKKKTNLVRSSMLTYNHGSSRIKVIKCI